MIRDKNNTDPVLIYRGPMSDLITRLKRISITTCGLSVGVLPALVVMKNVVANGGGGGGGGEILESAMVVSQQQLGLGGFALFSAVGSTLALQYVFGPYVVDLHTLSRARQGQEEEEEEEEGGDTQPREDDMTSPSPSPPLLQVRTCSVFGWWTNTRIVDPLRDDIEHPYTGYRPFANVAVNGTPYYVHPELLPEQHQQQQQQQQQQGGEVYNVRRLLLPNHVCDATDGQQPTTTTTQSHPQPGRDKEGLTTTTTTTTTKPSNRTNSHSQDDDFF
jgi:hypothetical protein